MVPMLLTCNLAMNRFGHTHGSRMSHMSHRPYHVPMTVPSTHLAVITSIFSALFYHDTITQLITDQYLRKKKFPILN